MMDIYEQIASYFTNLSNVNAWDGALSLFRNAADHRPKHWLLPLRACEAVGGTLEQAVPVVSALACSHIGILLVDDMLDADPRGEYQRIGAPSAANLACAFQSAALEAVANCKNFPEVKLAILVSINEMFLSTALGQSWDVQAPADEAAYWRVVRTKSSPFFGAALQSGALAGGASTEVANKLREVGCLYGEMIQIHDDLNDCMAVPANPDWIQGRAPLPILFAKVVDHPERARFLNLCRDIRALGALEEAQEILIRCGAVSFCVDQLLRRDRSASATLDSTVLVRREPLQTLFEDAVAPVYNLFESMGESLSDSSAEGWSLNPG